MITGAVDGKHLRLVGDTYARREEIKAIGAAWSKRGRGWTMPATIDAARALMGIPDTRLMGQEAAALLALADNAPPWPEALATAPWPHQRVVHDFAARRGGSVLAVTMGGGKSLSAIALLVSWKAELTLVTCPLSVIGVWTREVERHAPGLFRVVPLTGPVERKAAKLRFALESHRKGDRLIVVVNYESAWRGAMGQLTAVTHWDVLIADEIHKCKSPGGKASRHMAKIQATHKLGLTGTPLPNGPLDAYGQCRAIDPTIFGTSFQLFRSRFAIMGGYGNHQVLGFQNMDEFQEKLGRMAITVTREDAALSLPPTVDQTITVDLSPKASRAYEEMRQFMVAEIDKGEVVAANALVKSLRLAQLASGIAQPEAGGEPVIVCDAKLEALRDVLDGVGDARVVVFCRWVHDLDRVHEVAAQLKLRSAEISGRRKDALDGHGNMAADIDVAAVQLQSGGVGIDLTRASIAIYMGLSWSAADYEQSRARLDRPGQTLPVTFIHILARGTIDTAIRAALKRKLDLSTAIMEHLRISGGILWQKPQALERDPE